MAKSLLTMVRDGSAPSLRPVENIHYPKEGASELAKLETSHFWFEVRRELVSTLLQSHLKAPKSQVEGIEIGCGTGFTVDWLNQKGFSTIGLDAHPIPHTGLTSQKDSFVTGDIFSLEPVAEFDFVLLLDVIEHIENDGAFVAQALRFLKPEGILVISVPSLTWLWSYRDEYSGHLRRYTKRSLKELFSSIQAKGRIELASYFYASTVPLYLLWNIRERFSPPPSGSVSAGSPSPLVNSILKTILRLESRIVPFGGAPVGSSLFLVFRKS